MHESQTLNQFSKVFLFRSSLWSLTFPKLYLVTFASLNHLWPPHSSGTSSILLFTMAVEIKSDLDFVAWGPFIKGYHNEPITRGDIIVASTVWALTCLAALLAVYLAWGQTTASRSPLRSIYVWLIWIELLVCLLMGLECYLHLLKIIKPSKLKTTNEEILQC